MIKSALRTDCRLRPRYQLDLELQFSYRRGRRTYLGTGHTKDFSNKTLCFQYDQELPGGVDLELCIAWPAFLQGFYPLELIVQGTLIRKQNNLAVLEVEAFEFRTRGDSSFHQGAPQGSICDVLA